MEESSKNIAENLIMLRKANKLTQQEEAKVFGYTDKAISRWEKGESIPDMDTLLKICNYFSVDLNYLVYKHDTAPERVDIKEEQKWIGKRGMKVAVAFLFALFCFTIATFIFILYLFSYAKVAKWTSFLWATSASLLISALLSIKWWKIHITSILWSLTMWSIFASTYFEILINTTTNAWLLFIAGVPIQGIIVIISYLSMDSKKSRIS